MDAIKDSGQDAPTTELVTGAVGDRCTNCDSPLASDQRYCVNCGERRGKSRYSFASLAAQQAPAQAPAKERDAPRRPRGSAGATLVAGVATLLLAMGVGVLIGHDSNSSPSRASAPVQVLTIGGGGGGAASAATSSRGSKKGKTVKTKATKVVVTKKVAAAAAAAAGKVLGNSGNLASNATQQQGGACSGGAGCEGKRTSPSHCARCKRRPVHVGPE
jgi:hypothetical protein